MHCAAWDTYRSVRHHLHAEKNNAIFSYDYAALIAPTKSFFCIRRIDYFQRMHSSIRLSSIK